MKKRSLTLVQRNSLYGYAFILPFLIGAALFFAYPVITSIIFSISNLTVTESGYVLSYVGFKNYYDTLFVNADFNQILAASMISMVTNVPMIIVFSFFAASLLNQKFRGRAFARAVFFLPVILASGLLLNLDSLDIIQTGMRNGGMKRAQSVVSFVQSFDLWMFLAQMNINASLLNYITKAVDGIYQIVNKSGVQILIFLAGLQSIPPSLYEASHMEGATAWENFWKITFPMASPLILTNTVYTVIDSFTDYNNQTMKIIQDTAFNQQRWGESASMAWIYFLVIFIILGIIITMINKRVFYRD